MNVHLGAATTRRMHQFGKLDIHRTATRVCDTCGIERVPTANSLSPTRSRLFNMRSGRALMQRVATLLRLFPWSWRWAMPGLVALSAALPVASAHAQGFDRPGGDYSRVAVPSGDPAVCAARCEREGRCRAWTFSYPGTASLGGSNSATCWLKSTVTPAVENACCVSGVKGAGLVEKRAGPIETSTDRYGGDYRNFELPPDPSGESCKKACEEENRCRAWTYVRPGYMGASSPARCYLKNQVKPPRRKPCCLSGVVR
jgi:hypothetical protein